MQSERFITIAAYSELDLYCYKAFILLAVYHHIQVNSDVLKIPHVLPYSLDNLVDILCSVNISVCSHVSPQFPW